MSLQKLSSIRANLGEKPRGSLTPKPSHFTVMHELGCALPNPREKVVVGGKMEEVIQCKNF